MSEPEAKPERTTLSGKKKVAICLPVVNRPYQQTLDSIEASLPYLEAAGWTHGLIQTLNVPYISAARASMLRFALDAEADVIVFIDYDVSWDNPKDLLTLIEADGDVVAGTYRCKLDEEIYMGAPDTGDDYMAVVRESDGAIEARVIPAGFLKITAAAVEKFMIAYPDLCYGPKYHQSIDLFNHGVHEHIWWGEDYSFARRWREKCGKIWLLPNLGLDHNTKTKKYLGNYHNFLRAQPGGDLYKENQ